MRRILIFILLLSSIIFAQYSQNPTKYFADTNFVNKNGVVIWGDSFTEQMDSTIRVNAPFVVVPKGIAGQTTHEIKVRFLADTITKNMINVIWAGYNNLTDTTAVKQGVDSMIARLGNNTSYIVVSVMTGSADSSSTVRGQSITAINNYLSATYGTKFLDMKGYFLTLARTANDTIDINRGVVPRSLRQDVLHLSKAGSFLATDSSVYNTGVYGYNIAAQYLINKINTLYPRSTSKPITEYSLPNFLFNQQIKGINLMKDGVIYADGNASFRTKNESWFLFRAGALVLPSTLTKNNGFAGFQSGFLLAANAFNNFGYGDMALRSLTTGDGNSAFGYQAGYAITTSDNNTAIGTQALITDAGYEGNTAVGRQAGYSQNNHYGLFLGQRAGYYYSGYGALFLNSISRGSLANDTTKSIIFGVQTDAATGASGQRLKFNADVNIAGDTYITSASYFYLAGNATTAGSWRLTATTSGNCLIEYTADGNTWTAKQTLTP